MNDAPARQSYRAPAWLPGGHAQTIYAKAIRMRPPAYRRQRWDTPDGDFIDLDWIERCDGAPLVALFHGLEGNSRSHYAVALMRALAAHRWNGVVSHFRGCSGEPNRRPRAYHSGDHEEIDWVLRRLRALHAGPLFAVGISLGGSALLNWIGRQGDKAFTTIAAGAAVCAPLDLTAAGLALESGFNRVYARYFLRSMIPAATHKLERFPRLYDGARIRAARTLREFDDVVTAPLHGFRDAADYWRRASSKPWLREIRIPTLVINARNDPFVPAGALPAADEVASSVVLEYPEEGGHVGFVAGPFPGHSRWLPRRLIRFFAAFA